MLTDYYNLSDSNCIAIYINSSGYLTFETPVNNAGVYEWTSTTPAVSTFQLSPMYRPVIIGQPIVDNNIRLALNGSTKVSPIYVAVGFYASNSTTINEIDIIQCVTDGKTVNNELTKEIYRFTNNTKIISLFDDFQLTYVSSRDDYNNIKGCIFNAVIGGQMQWYKATSQLIKKVDSNSYPRQRYLTNINESIESIGDANYVIGIVSEGGWYDPTGSSPQDYNHSTGMLSLFKINTNSSFEYPTGLTTTEYFITSKYFATNDMLWVKCKNNSIINIRPNSDIFILSCQKQSFYMNLADWMNKKMFFVFPIKVKPLKQEYLPYVSYTFPYTPSDGYILCCNKNDLFSIEEREV